VAADDRPPTVALVAADGNIRRRATSVLAQDGQVILVEAATSDELAPEDARRADAVVIAAAARADQRAAAIRTARMRLPDARVIVIATADANGVHKALEAGAHGFVFDADLVDTLAPTVRAVRCACSANFHAGDRSAVRDLRARRATLRGVWTADHLDMVHLRGVAPHWRAAQVLSALRPGPSPVRSLSRAGR